MVITGLYPVRRAYNQHGQILSHPDSLPGQEVHSAPGLYVVGVEHCRDLRMLCQRPGGQFLAAFLCKFTVIYNLVLTRDPIGLKNGAVCLFPSLQTAEISLPSNECNAAVAVL